MATSARSNEEPAAFTSESVPSRIAARLSEQATSPSQRLKQGNLPTLGRRLGVGLVADVPHPDLLVTRTHPSPVLSMPPANVEASTQNRALLDLRAVAEHPGIADLAASLESLNEISQSVMASLTAITEAPGELQTVVAVGRHPLESLAHQLERQLANVNGILNEQVAAAVAAAQQLRSDQLEAATADQPDVTGSLADLSERLAALEASPGERHHDANRSAADGPAEVAERALERVTEQLT